jgi:hypothetical protein
LNSHILLGITDFKSAASADFAIRAFWVKALVRLGSSDSLLRSGPFQLGVSALNSAQPVFHRPCATSSCHPEAKRQRALVASRTFIVSGMPFLIYMISSGHLPLFLRLPYRMVSKTFQLGHPDEAYRQLIPLAHG